MPFDGIDVLGNHWVAPRILLKLTQRGASTPDRFSATTLVPVHVAPTWFVRCPVCLPTRWRLRAASEFHASEFRRRSVFARNRPVSFPLRRSIRVRSVMAEIVLRRG